MTIELKLSNLPESVTDGTVVEWLKQPGDMVKRDEKVVDIETDKILLEIPSPCDGVLTEIIADNGTIVTSNQVLATFSPQSESDTSESTSSKLEEDMITTIHTSKPASEHNRLSPAVRHLLEQHQLDADLITATGSKGQLLKSDVLDYLAKKDGPKNAINETVKEQEATKEIPPIANKQNSQQVAPSSLDPRTRRVPMSRLRTKIAERLLESQQSTAMLTTFNEADMSAIMKLRAQHGEAFLKRHDVKLGFMSFFVKAVSAALQQFPIVNASIENNDIVYHNYVDVGIAVGSKRGLVVPVLRDSDLMHFAEVEKSIVDYAQKSRDGSIDLEDIMGGTFTITNGGVFGSLLSTPIINPPQSAILGLHKIQKRPIVETINGKDEIVIRPMMYLALSYDHRIIDGSDAVQFLVAIKAKIEDPVSLLIEV